MSDEMPSKIDSKTVFLKEEEKLVDSTYEEIDNLESKDSLIRVIQNLADNRLKSRNILAVDDSNNTLQEITKVVSKSLTTGKVRILEEEEALLDRDRKQSDFDQLTVDLHLDPVSIKEMHNRWSAEAGLVENIDHIIRECRESRQLVASLEEVKMEEQELLEAKATPLRNRLMKHVMPTLTRALIDCVKVRPEDAIDVIASQEEEEEDVSPLQSQLLVSLPLTDTQTSDFEAAPVEGMSSPLLNDLSPFLGANALDALDGCSLGSNLYFSDTGSGGGFLESQASSMEEERGMTSQLFGKGRSGKAKIASPILPQSSYLSAIKLRPVGTTLTLLAIVCILLLCSTTTDAQQCKKEDQTCDTEVPKQIDFCQQTRHRGQKFKLMTGGSDILISSICRCRLHHLQEVADFSIVISDFSCPVDACPWRLQIVVDGCVRSQYCCSPKWEQHEVIYFPRAEQKSSVNLQLSQLSDLPEEIGTVSVSISIEEIQLSERGAQLTCGLTTNVNAVYDFAKCGRMPDLKNEPESFVPLKKTGDFTIMDLCKPACSSKNPLTFSINVGVTYGPLICSAKIETIEGPNVYFVTITQFFCPNQCSYHLLIVVGNCIKYTICCQPDWKNLTKFLENANNEASVQLIKVFPDPEALSFSVTTFVGDSLSRPISKVKVWTGDRNITEAKNCLLLTGSTAASIPNQQQDAFKETQQGEEPVMSDDAGGERSPKSNVTKVAIPATLFTRIKEYFGFMVVLKVVGFVGGGFLAIRVALKIIRSVGYGANGPVPGSLAFMFNNHATANPGSMSDRVNTAVLAVAANGFNFFQKVMLFLLGGVVSVLVIDAVASPFFYFLP